MDWSSVGPDLASNLLANVIFAVMVAVAAIVLGNIAWRRKVRAFFNMKPNRGRLPVYLSNIVVHPGGTTGTGPISVGYHGTAITELEYKYALAFAATVESKPLYRALRALDSAELLTTVDPIVCHIGTSPAASELGDPSRVSEYIREGTTLIVGAPIYNSLTDYVMRTVPSHFEFIRFDDKERGIKVRNFKGSDTFVFKRGLYTRERPDGKERPFLKEYFIIERLTWKRGTGRHKRKSTIFICAGTCSASTAAALRMLADWPKLAKVYGTEDFGLLCEIHLDAADGRDTIPREMPPPEDEPFMVHHYGES
ncbi:hypothetical protein [Nonomuraea sp. NPDC049695]|uniref:hypothetical protein n=1 Tax=Nonomuraea sp. NPDC049695 TaxID=3154734 RepID=UPI003417DF09